MRGRIRDEGPLPEEALRNLGYMNEAAQRTELLEQTLADLLSSWEDGDLTLDEIEHARTVLSGLPPGGPIPEETA